MKNITSKSLLFAAFTFSATPISDNGDVAMWNARIAQEKALHKELDTLNNQIDEQSEAIGKITIVANEITHTLIENGFAALRKSEHSHDGTIAYKAVEAKRAFEYALIFTPNSAEAHLGKAHTCDILQEFECAEFHEDRARAIYKSTQPPYKNINRLSSPANPDVLLAM